MGQAIPTGQWIIREGQNWWFDAGSVAIDFAYAGGFDGEPETLDRPAALGAWLTARFPELEGEPLEREFTDARALQRALARMVTAAGSGRSASAEDVDIVNLFAATPDIPPSLAGGTRQAGRSRVRVGQCLSAITRDAVNIFGAANLERVRSCAADDCSLVFYDESRSNNRRWCSMQRCGNRAKVRAHRQRGSTR